MRLFILIEVKIFRFCRMVFGNRAFQCFLIGIVMTLNRRDELNVRYDEFAVFLYY